MNASGCPNRLTRPLVFVTAFVSAVLTVMVPRLAPTILAVGPLLALCVTRQAKLRLTAPMVALAAILAWAGLSSFWSITPLASLAGTGKSAFIILMSCFLLSLGELRTSATIRSGLVIGFWSACIALWLAQILDEPVLLLHQWLTGIVLKDVGSQILFRRETAVALVLAWPMAGASRPWLGRWWWLPLLITVAIAISSDSSTVTLALIVSGVIYVGVSIFPKGTIAMLAGATALAFVAFPIIASEILPAREMIAVWPDYLPLSLQHRLEIWRFVAESVHSAPILGWGMNTSPAIPGGGDVLILSHSMSEIPIHEQHLPLHPHNLIAQIWLELGGVGAMLGLVVILATLRIYYSLLERAAIPMATLGTIIGFAALSFGMWQSWWMATQALAFCLLALYSAPPAAGALPK